MGGAGTGVESGATGTVKGASAGAGVRTEWEAVAAGTGADADARLKVLVKAECTTEDPAVGV